MSDYRRNEPGERGERGDSISPFIRITLIISSSAAVSLVVSLLTGTMNIGGYIRQIGLNTLQVQETAAQVQVLMIARSAEKSELDGMRREMDKLESDRDTNYGTVKGVAERLATLEAQMTADDRRIRDLQSRGLPP